MKHSAANFAEAAVHFDGTDAIGTAADTGETVVPPIASHPQRDRREAEEKGQDRQAGEESATKDCEGLLSVEGSHEMEIVNKGVEQSRAAKPVPCPREPITIRPATMDDLAFMDGLQKIHTKMVGFMQTKALEGKIKAGHVLVAESDEATERRSDEGEDTGESASAFPSVASSLRRSVAVPVGYLIGNDQYFKRDDVGIIYQMNVVPGKQRGFVGATLLKAMFDRAAYGCKLFCCWCAQDIEANRFWESLGFVPLAFRAGSRGKGRVHIFWQRRIRAGDTTTPYWFPSQTTSGSIREDRLVLPIPPGKRWSDQMPRVLPQGELPVDEPKRLPGTRAKKVKAEPKKSIYAITRSKLHFTVPMPAKAANQKAPREKRKAVKNDPRLVAAARELRDRWVERVNADPTALLPHAKYEVGRALVAQAAPLQIAA